MMTDTRTNNESETLYQQGMAYIEQNQTVEAAVCFKKAADLGHAEAQYKLGLCYEKGHGIEQATETADYWYYMARKHGYSKAKAQGLIIKAKQFFNKIKKEQ